MKFSGCGSYHKDTCNVTVMNSCSIQYLLNKLEAIMTALESMVFLLLTNQFISYGLIKQFAYP